MQALGEAAPALRSLQEAGASAIAIGRIEDAVGLLDKALRAAPDDPRLLTSLGCAREMNGQGAEAARLYRLAIGRSRAASVATANLGYLMLVHGNVSGALECHMRGSEMLSPAGPLALVPPSFRSSALPGRNLTQADHQASVACLFWALKLLEAGRLK